MLFKKKKKPTAPKPDAVFTYLQTKNYRGFKRIKLTSHGYKPAEDGIDAVAEMDLTDATIDILMMDKPGAPYAIVKVGPHHVGTIFSSNFDQFGALRDGKVSAVRLEIRDGESFLFYKV